MDKKYTHVKLEELLLDDDFPQIAKLHFSGKNSADWEQLLEDYPEKKDVFEKAYRIVNSVRIKEIQVDERQIAKEWELLNKKIRQRKSKRILYWISSAAACLLLIVCGYYFRVSSETTANNKQTLLSRLTETDSESNDIQLIVGENEKTTLDENATIRETDDGSLTINDDTKIETNDATADYIQLIVPKGKRSHLELKDGSRIWVNSGSKLLYPSRFDNKKREIYVDGEIYLEVAPKASSPFYVHTSALDIKVLGTSFNVSAYSDDTFTEVVLVTGNVEVNVNKKVTSLTPNTYYQLENGREQMKTVDVSNYICWKDGIMKMHEEELKDIFKRLSRYYNVQILAPPELERVHYSGKLGLEDSIEHVLYNISLVEPVGFEREGNIIQVYPASK